MNHRLRLVAAGLLALPALIVLVAVAPVIAILSAPSLAILVRRKRRFFPSFAPSSRRADAFADADARTTTKRHPLLQHAVITGGSSGIGLSIAIELARRNCQHITLIARNVDQLTEAKRLVEAEAAATTATTANHYSPSSVRILSVDVTNFAALEKEVAKLCGGEEDGNNSSDKNTGGGVGPPTLLINCAGYAIPLAFEDLSVLHFRAQVDLNYLGSVHVVKAFLPYMIANTSNVGGNIILTSSMSGQAGTFGYSSYSPTKFALRGFAECLSMELATNMSNNVNISLAYPPDTKTPGYDIENKSKPEECRLISESAGIWDSDVVGRGIVDQALTPNPPFDIYFGVDGWMLSMLTSGMNPGTSVIDAIWQVALMGLLRYVSLFYLMDFGRITQMCHSEKVRSKEDTCKND